LVSQEVAESANDKDKNNDLKVALMNSIISPGILQPGFNGKICSHQVMTAMQ